MNVARASLLCVVGSYDAKALLHTAAMESDDDVVGSLFRELRRLRDEHALNAKNRLSSTESELRQEISLLQEHVDRLSTLLKERHTAIVNLRAETASIDERAKVRLQTAGEDANKDADASQRRINELEARLREFKKVERQQRDDYKSQEQQARREVAELRSATERLKEQLRKPPQQPMHGNGNYKNSRVSIKSV